jgi:hypothetical protein
MVHGHCLLVGRSGSITVAPIQTFDPARMTPAQRRAEAAALLALGVHRLRGGDAHTTAVAAPAPAGSGLGFVAAQRVHADSTNRSPQA